MKYSRNCTSYKNYAKAYVIPQLYENLFSIEEDLIKGTIFMDLYRPYIPYKPYKKYKMKGDMYV